MRLWQEKVRYAAKVTSAAAFAVWMIVGGNEVRSSAYNGLLICRDVILTTVFPFACAADLLIRSGVCGVIGRYAGRPFSVLLGLSGCGAGIFLLSLVGGYPSGAAAVRDSYDSGMIGKSEAEILISYTNNASPAFCIVFAGGLLGSARAGAMCYAVLIFSAILWGTLLRKRTDPVKGGKDGGVHDFSFSSSVSSAASSAVMICANVIVFSVISGALTRLPAGAALSALSEITNGVIGLSAAIADPRLRACAVCSLISFSGFCVASQVSGVAGRSGLSSRLYMSGKIFQAFISFFALYLLYPLFLS